MQYRKIEKLGIEVSAFGVGCMRFPMKKLEDGTEVVDESISTPAIRHAVDCGVNYIDTAYVYSGGRKNEIALGHALRDGYRDKVYIATKLPSWPVQSKDDMWRILGESLEDLERFDATDFINALFETHEPSGADASDALAQSDASASDGQQT